MKPDAVQRAQYVLWAWTAWTCLFGIFQLWSPSPATQEFVTQIQDVVGVTPESVRGVVIGGYVLVALSMAGLIAQIGAGKRWPRMLLLIGVVVEAVWVAGQGVTGVLDVLGDALDFGLQGYAIFLLYAKPGRDWFKRKAA